MFSGRARLLQNPAFSLVYFLTLTPVNLLDDPVGSGLRLSDCPCAHIPDPSPRAAVGPPCIPESSPLEARAAPKSWPRRVDPVRVCDYRGWSSLLLSVATTRSFVCGEASYFGESFTGRWYWPPLEQAVVGQL